MAPPNFSDINKASNDLFKKDFPTGVKLEGKVVNDASGSMAERLMIGYSQDKGSQWRGKKEHDVLHDPMALIPRYSNLHSRVTKIPRLGPLRVKLRANTLTLHPKSRSLKDGPRPICSRPRSNLIKTSLKASKLKSRPI